MPKHHITKVPFGKMVSERGWSFIDNMANSLNVSLHGKTVLLKKKNFRDGIDDLRFRVDEDGGFGASPTTNGTSLYGTFLCDGEHSRVNGYDVESIVE